MASRHHEKSKRLGFQLFQENLWSCPVCDLAGRCLHTSLRRNASIGTMGSVLRVRVELDADHYEFNEIHLVIDSKTENSNVAKVVCGGSD